MKGEARTGSKQTNTCNGSRKVEPHGTFHIHTDPRPAFCTDRHSSTVQPLCSLLSFVCSEVQHIDRGPYQKSQAEGVGRRVGGAGRDEEKLKVFQAIAETIQLQCLSNLASQVIASNCLTKIDTSVATV